MLLDNEDYTFIFLGPREESYWDFSLLYYACNNTDQDLNFTSEELTVNGEECYYGFDMDLPAGCRGIGSFGFDFEDIEAEIDSVEEIAFLLSIREAGNWDAEPQFTGSYSYEP